MLGPMGSWILKVVFFKESWIQDRLGGGPLAPCVTPNALLYDFQRARPFTAADKMIFQGMPLQKLKIQHMSENVTCKHFKQFRKNC